MIVTNLERARFYSPLHPMFLRAIAFLRAADEGMAEGRHELAGDSLFATVQRYTTEPADARRYESHRRYIDVQYLLAGREALDVQDIDALTVTEPYDAEKDVMFYSGGVGGSRRGGEQRVVLTPGVCCVLFPEDGHKPCCEVVGPEEVCKVVVKIAIRA